jgi:P27 family predicted phage terminase small subunit
MARTGRPRKSPELKVVKGNFQGKKLAPPESEKSKGKKTLSPDAPERPIHLDDIEGKIWDQLIPHLSLIGTLQKCDLGSLESYCTSYASLIRNKQSLTQHRKKYGSDYFETDGKHGRMIRVHPAVGVIDRAQRLIKMLAVEFGMTPSSRKAMGYDPAQLFLPFNEKSDDDPTKGLLS